MDASRVFSVVLAGGEGKRLAPLTADRAKPAVPFGGDYRLIAAEGAFSGRTFPSTGTANAGFRFDRGLEGWKTWCRLGANHHSSASPGALAGAAAACARFAGMQYGVA